MVPAAPVTSSTTTFWPSVWPMCCASSRPMTSVGPPAANGTIMVIGRDGYSSAVAATVAVQISASAAVKTPFHVSSQPFLFPRHCEERSDEAIQNSLTVITSRPGLLRSARNDDLQRRVIDRLMPVERALDRRQRLFRSGRTVEQHRLLGARNTPVGETLFVGRIGSGAFRAHQKALFAGNLLQSGRNRLIRHRDGETAALAHRAQDEEIADRLRHADTGRDGVRIFPAGRVLDSLLVGAHHRRAARRLHRYHARALAADEADCLQLGKRQI